MKTKRFFYHYHRNTKRMSIHFNKNCIQVDNIKCLVGTETKWNKIQPFLVMRGFAKEINYEIEPISNKTTAIIS